jgi:hypothetical protein
VHDDENWIPVFCLRETRFGGRRKAAGDHAQVKTAARVLIRKVEEPMRIRAKIPIALGTIVLGCCIGMSIVDAQTLAPNPAGDDDGISGALEQKPLLTPAQRNAIYREVSKDKSQTAAKEFSPVVGADVPPMIDLYTLPDDAVADIPAAKLYKYTMVQNKVVLVDPTRMRIIDVIGPTPGQ